MEWRRGAGEEGKGRNVPFIFLTTIAMFCRKIFVQSLKLSFFLRTLVVCSLFSFCSPLPPSAAITLLRLADMPIVLLPLIPTTATFSRKRVNVLFLTTHVFTFSFLLFCFLLFLLPPLPPRVDATIHDPTLQQIPRWAHVAAGLSEGYDRTSHV